MIREKIADVRALTVIFYVQSWKMRKKNRQIFLGDYDKTRNLYWFSCLDLPMYQMVTLAWKWVQECQKRPAH